VSKRLFITSWVASTAFLFSIFIATMITQYRRIDVPYLFYGFLAATLVAGIASVASGYLIRRHKVLSVFFSITLSILLVFVFVTLRT